MPKRAWWRSPFPEQLARGERWLKMEEKGVKWGIKQDGGSAR
jgi:hypothetical protein